MMGVVVGASFAIILGLVVDQPKEVYLEKCTVTSQEAFSNWKETGDKGQVALIYANKVIGEQESVIKDLENRLIRTYQADTSDLEDRYQDIENEYVRFLNAQGEFYNVK